MAFGDTIKIRKDALDEARDEISLKDDPKKSVRVSDRFDELRALECFDMVKSRLLHGHTPGDVAKFIIDEAKEFDKFTRIRTKESLRDLLYDFKGTFKASEILSKTLPESITELKKKMEDGVDEIKELEYLYTLQKDRIEIDYATEKKIHKLFKTTGNEIAIAMGILKITANLKQDLGLMRRDLGTVEVDHTLRTEFPYKSKAIEEVMRDPVSRGKVIGAVRRLLARPDLSGDIIKGFGDVSGAEPVDVEVINEEKKEISDASE